MAELVARGVTVRYGGVRALTDVAFQAGGPRAVGIIGPNGAGKSTLVEVLAGFRKPTGGSVALDGKTLAAGRGHKFARAGVVRAWQATRLFGRLTVLENLLVARLGRDAGSRGRIGLPEMLGSFGAAEAEEGLDFLAGVGLADSAGMYARDLSGGQKRLLELARAIWLKPAVLLLDEPSVGIAPAMRRTVIHALREHCIGAGATVIVVEHELEVIAALCEETYVLIGGHVVTRGRLDDVLRHPEVRRGYLGAKDEDDAGAPGRASRDAEGARQPDPAAGTGQASGHTGQG